MSNNPKLVCRRKKQVESVQVDDSIEYNLCSRLPPEIWVKIFKLTEKNILGLRLVCKHWQAILDENFDKKVVINDDRADVTSLFKLKRVVDCTVQEFTRDYPVLLQEPIQLFLEPQFLARLYLPGCISKSNFIAIAQQCQNVKDLTIDSSLLIGDSDLNLLEVVSQKDIEILMNFMGGLHKLEVNSLDYESSNDNSPPINLFSLLKWQMNELKTLVIQANRVNFLVGKSKAFEAEEPRFFRLLEKFHSLVRLDYTAKRFYILENDVPNGFVLPNLSILNIEEKFPSCLPVWLKFIQAHNLIKHLKLVVTDARFCLGHSVVNAILNNGKSLENLEMRTIKDLDDELVAQLFGGLSSLKSLILEGYRHEYLRNIGLLPKSLEMLTLENFKCISRELLRIKNDKCVFKLKNVSMSMPAKCDYT